MAVFSDAFVGPAAGVATSLLWTATSLFFTAAAWRLGPTFLNVFRIAIAIVLLAVTHRLLAGVWIPHAVSQQVLLLALSGVVGLSIGDQLLFSAFVDIGPRLSMLLMTTSPLWAALFGWLALEETLQPIAWMGIAMTIGGVGWVVLERPAGHPSAATTRRMRGYLFAMAAAACQAGGLMLSKRGMGHGWLLPAQHMSPQTATLIRMFFAGLGMIPIVALHLRREKRRRTRGGSAVRRGSRGAGYCFAVCGALVGPYLGVWLSLVASDRAPLGVAQTLCSLAPVFILPFAVLLHHERIGVRAVLGAVIAVAGSALLFLPAA